MGRDNVVRIGTRGSRLALAQAQWVKAAIEAARPGTSAEVEIIVTSGDRLAGSLARIGGKGLFVKEIEQALYDGHVDLAVHSMKDLPIVVADGLEVAAVPKRVDPRDVVVGAVRQGRGVDGLPSNASVGTTSLRRRAQLLAMRPDLRIVELRGNVDTRLRKRDEGQCDAVVVAAAGLERLGIRPPLAAPLDPTAFVPAVGQGALALETRIGDARVRGIVGALDDAAAAAAVVAERAFLRALGGDCVTPIAAHARLDGATLRLQGLVATPDGRRMQREAISGPNDDPAAIGLALAELLRSRGADDILAQVHRQMAGAAHE